MRILMIILIIGLITQGSRLVPALLTKKLKLSKKQKKFLSAVPYAALGAMIFPGILQVGNKPIIGLAGGATAALLAYKKVNTIGIIAGAIAMVALFNTIIN